ncbi:Uncharacterised protein [Helicobacter acinonychis]|uniref:Uncharacterized protein n=1 Tax=Helicobacter acinonychis (strain Sheeba) TaxID=382638 RepID=Q17X77_HELAH|nr:conserved hypothetical protein [Helicobacter acinonychis str. Sheeba]STP04306.1 Uncharacterised protein [Helicobacter acinonychis]
MNIPHFFKIIIETSVIVGVLLGLWCLTYDKFCFSLLFVLLILGIVAYSYISLKMHQRKCFAKCFLNSQSWLAKLLHSPIMVTIFYFVYSILISISIAYSVLDYNLMMWGVVFINIVFCTVVFSMFEKIFKNIVNEEYLMLMSREMSAMVGTFFFVSISCYVIYHNNMPNYLQPNLWDTIKAASNSLYSSCDDIDYFLKSKKMLEGFAWWGMLKAETFGINGRLEVMGWAAFIFYNALSGIAIVRLSVQIIYVLSKYFKEQL